MTATPYKQHEHDGEKILPHTSSCVSYLGITNFIASNLSVLTLSQNLLLKLEQDCQKAENETNDAYWTFTLYKMLFFKHANLQTNNVVDWVVVHGKVQQSMQRF